MARDLKRDLEPSLAAYRELVGLLERLARGLRLTSGLKAWVYRPDEVSSAPLPQADALSPPAHNVVEAYTGQPAVALAAQLFAKTLRDIPQNPHATERLAGLVWAGGLALSAQEELRALLAAVHRAKGAFAEAIHTFEPSTELRRRLLAGSPLQHVHIIEASRQIAVLPDTTESLSFGWSARSRSIRRIKANDLINQLAARGALGVDTERKLRALEGQAVAVVRTLQPFVTANVVTGLTTPPRKRLLASLPFVCFSATPPLVRPLKPFTPSERRQKPQLILEPALVPALGIYRYRPGAHDKPPENTASCDTV